MNTHKGKASWAKHGNAHREKDTKTNDAACLQIALYVFPAAPAQFVFCSSLVNLLAEARRLWRLRFERRLYMPPGFPSCCACSSHLRMRLGTHGGP